MGFIQILGFLRWGCSARWFQLPCVPGRVSQPGMKCPARPLVGLSPSLGQCGLWLSPAAQTFVNQPQINLWSSCRCMYGLALCGRAAVCQTPELLQATKGQSLFLKQPVNLPSGFSYFSLLCITSHSCTRIIYSSQRQLIWTKKTFAGGKTHILSSLPTQDWWEKNKGGEARRTRSGKELKAETWSAFCFLPVILCARGVVSWIQLTRRRKIRISQGMTWTWSSQKLSVLVCVIVVQHYW